jgi:outer membrane protein assembly factor BamB
MARASLIRCPACSAPLQAQAGQDYVTCGYCHATSHVSKARPAPQTPPGPKGSPGGLAKPKSGGGVAVLGVFIGMLVIGGVTWVFLGSGSTSLLFSEWYGVACSVDANGDDVIDFAGRIGRPGTGPHRVAVVDGIDGSVLWTSEAKHGWESWVMCLSSDRFAVAQPDFSVDLYAASGGAPKTTRLADGVIQYGSKDDCALFYLKDGSSVGMALPSGDRVECDTELTHAMTGTRRGETDAVVELDGSTYVAEARDRGTPTLTLRAEADGEVQWSVALRHAAIDRSQVPLAVTPDAVLTYGTAPGSDEGVLVGLDRSDGRVRFEATQRNRWSNRPSSGLVYNGRHVVIGWGFGLHAYDPRTGERVWKVGGRS